MDLIKDWELLASFKYQIILKNNLTIKENYCDYNL